MRSIERVETFNSFPVAALTMRVTCTMRISRSFQFFPSCSRGRTCPAGRESQSAFNSFPVAAPGRAPVRFAPELLSILSQLQREANWGPKYEAVKRAFQFFPSCSLVEFRVLRSKDAAFQFFPSCSPLDPGKQRQPSSLHFQFFPSCSQVPRGVALRWRSSL